MNTASSDPPNDSSSRDSPVRQGADRPAGPTLPPLERVEPGRPYPPGWVDRLTERVRRLPGPAWVSYLGLGLGLSLAYLALALSSTQWARGALSLNTVLLYSLLNGLTCAYLLGLIHYLDDAAAAALARFRPVLTVDDAGYDRLRYQLTTLPARPTLIATLLGVFYTFVAMLLNIITLQNQEHFTESPVTRALVIGFNILIYSLVAVVVYHTLHQLRMVNAIYTEHTRINLFQLGPLYALSGLTARTAIGIGIPTYLWFQANSLTLQGPAATDIIQTVFLAIITGVTFISPLLGAHRLLEQEKQRLQDEVARRIEATLARLHHRADADDLADFAALKGVLDGLVAEQGVIDKLRTWPWRTGTVSALGLAFFVPVIIWVVQRLLERLGV